MTYLFSASVLFVACLYKLGGVWAGCADGEPSAWCVLNNMEVNSSPLYIDTSKTVEFCRSSCVDDAPCKSFSYLAAEEKCSYFGFVGDDRTLVTMQGSDHHWLNCGADSCSGDTTASATVATTTQAKTTTKEATTTSEVTTTSQITTKKTPTTVKAEDTTTTTMEQEIFTTEEKDITTEYEITETTSTETMATTEEPEALWKIQPVWAAMIGMSVFAVLLIITIFVLLCTLKSRQSLSNQKSF